MEFSNADSTTMHIDMNSCFCSIEQQANPLLRNKPIAVVAYMSPGACILTASIEAKRFGVETGMRIKDGKLLCPQLICMMPDPPKYRYANRKFLQFFQQYTDQIAPLSIDEFAIDFSSSPTLYAFNDKGLTTSQAMHKIGLGIKEKINDQYDWMKVSIGFGPNRFLAKMASNLQKPDGLHEISKQNILQVLQKMELEDIKGIKQGNGTRLRSYGINTALKFFYASQNDLKQAFRSIVGYYWWMRLHGYEPDKREFPRKSFGNQHALFTAYYPTDHQLHQVLCQITMKIGYRIRKAGYSAQGINVACLFDDYTYWHESHKTTHTLTADNDIYKEALHVLLKCPNKRIRTLSASCHYLNEYQATQELLFENNERKHNLMNALDKITNRWGSNTVTPATLLNLERKVLDRVPFGATKELEEFIFQENISSEEYID